MKAPARMLFAILAAAALLPAQTSIQQAYGEFERCALSLTRAERAMDRLKEKTKTLEELSGRRPDDAALDGLVQALSAKNDYFLSCADRLREEAAERKADLDAVNGPVCSSCLESGIDRFCRDGASLLGEVEDELRKIEDLLGRLGPPPAAKAGKGDSSSHPEKRTGPAWRVSLGADYYRFQDVDTAVMTAGQRDSLRRLEEAPFSFYARTGLSRSWTGRWEGTFCPALTLSDRRSRLFLPASFGPGAGFLRIEPVLKAEKSFRGRLYSTVHGDSSDMGGAGIVLKAVKGNPGEGNADYALPLGVDWEHYRENRPGYVSHVTFRASPSWDLRFDNGSLGIASDLRLEDCYGPDSGRLDADSLDAALGRMTLSSRRRFSLLEVSTDLSYYGDRYYSDKRREKRDVCESMVRLSAGRAGKPRSELEVRYEWEQDRRGLALTGDRLRLLARGEIPLRRGWSMRPGFLFEDRSAALRKVRSPASGEDYFLYLWENFRSVEPFAEISFRRENGAVSVSGAFRFEDVAENSAYSLVDSRAFKTAANGEWRFLGPWSFLASVEYQYRIYRPFDLNSRQTMNLAASGSVSVRF